MDPKALFKLSYGLYILSSRSEERDCGCIINTLTQVTAEPPRLSVAVNKQNFTAGAIARSGVFTAVALAEQADMELIGAFGFQSSAQADKFKGFPIARDENGVAYVTRSAAARFSCRVVGSLDVGTHLIFVGELTGAEVLSQDPVMTYAYYHAVVKGGTPKNAPSYQEPEKQEGAKGYRCSVCGYRLESDLLPPDFVCPICGQPASRFVKL